MLHRLSELRSLVDELRARTEVTVAGSRPDAVGEQPSAAQPAPAVDAADRKATRFAVLRYALLPALLLLGAHHLLVFTFDLGPVWLMLATLVLPFPFGLEALLRSDRGLLFWTAAFLGVVVVTMVAMNLDAPFAGRDPNAVVQVFPSTAAEWTQEAEFAAGLYLSFLSGLLSALLILRALLPQHPQLRASRDGMALAAHHLRIASSAGSVEKVAKYLNSFGVIASTVGAIYLAIKRV